MHYSCDKNVPEHSLFIQSNQSINAKISFSAYPNTTLWSLNYKIKFLFTRISELLLLLWWPEMWISYKRMLIYLFSRYFLSVLQHVLVCFPRASWNSIMVRFLFGIKRRTEKLKKILFETWISLQKSYIHCVPDNNFASEDFVNDWRYKLQNLRIWKDTEIPRTHLKSVLKW